MKFDREILQDLANEDHSPEYEIVSNELVDHSRWSLSYEMIFKYRDKFYRTWYNRGATECQDESPYEYEPSEIELVEVEPYEKTVTDYREVR